MNNGVFFDALLDNLFDGVYFVDRERNITFWNKGAERITGHAAADVVGMRCTEDLFLHMDKSGSVLCSEICPIADAMADGIERSTEVFIHHKNGHRVPVVVRVSPIRDGGGAIVGGVEVITDNTPAAAAFERLAELERMAFLDPLTGIANRRYMEITLNARLEELQRYNWRFGILFMDIDHFKQINDRHGHHAGDDVLRMVARTLQNSLRSFDMVSRWGGEEYLAVIANVEAAELGKTANRCRMLVEQSSLPSVPAIRATISVGATLAFRDDTPATLIKRADSLMYRSKQEGRNRVTVDG